MTWFAKKPEMDVQTTPDVLTVRDLTVRDLMRFFRERGTSVSDAIRCSAFFAGFSVANEISVNGMADDDAEARRLMRAAHEAIDEGVRAVRAALDSEIGRTLTRHKFI